MVSASEATPSSGRDRERQVQTIFSEIAPRYDLLNHVLSLNIDRAWRRHAVESLEWTRAPSGTYLDGCAGTYDLALELARRAGFGGRVLATDFARPMLEEGRPKLGDADIVPLCADSLRLPFPEGTFDGATVGFGVRNLSDLDRGLGEMYRVLKPGARTVILDFTIPPNRLVRAGYLFYFNRILPLVGRLVSGHPWAYRYLPESVKEFPDPEGFRKKLEAAGFRETSFRLLSLGIAAIHVGRK